MRKLCVRCKSKDTCRSRRRNWLERLTANLGCKPYRCRTCGKRFFMLWRVPIW